MTTTVFVPHRFLFMVSVLLALQVQLAAAQPLPTGAMQLAPGTFSDVPEEHWAVDAVARMSVLGVLTGFADSTFRGEEYATRYQLAVVLARLFDIYSGAYPLPSLLPPRNSDGAVDSSGPRLVSPHLVADLNDARIERLERALENSSSLEYVQSLERRVAELEQAFTASTGKAPSSTPVRASGAFPLSAADTVPPEPTLAEMVAAAEGAENPSSAGVDLLGQAADGGAAQPGGAQIVVPGSDAERFWFGVSAGFPLGAALHFGVHDVLASVDLRGSTSLVLGGPVELAFDALIELPVIVEGLPMEVYAGLGSTLSVAATRGTLSLQAVLGVEYRLGPGGRDPGGFFAEAGPSVGIVPELGTGFVVRAGFNYHQR